MTCCPGHEAGLLRGSGDGQHTMIDVARMSLCLFRDGHEGHRMKTRCSARVMIPLPLTRLHPAGCGRAVRRLQVHRDAAHPAAQPDGGLVEPLHRGEHHRSADVRAGVHPHPRPDPSSTSTLAHILTRQCLRFGPRPGFVAPGWVARAPPCMQSYTSSIPLLLS